MDAINLSRGTFTSISIELNLSRGTFRSIAIELNLDGRDAPIDDEVCRSKHIPWVVLANICKMCYI